MSDYTEYSHEAYKKLLEEAEISTGKHNCYFCPGCQRYIPKKESKDPCPFCGEKDWHLNNPLIHKIINTDPLKKLMYQTFRHCIEPFTGFDIQQWKCGNIFYKFSGEKHRNQANKKHHYKDVELWGISHRGFSGYFISLCLRWKEVFIHSDKTRSEQTYLKYFTFRAESIYNSDDDCGEEYDDRFFFNLIFEEACQRRGNISQLCFKTSNTEKKDFDAYVYVKSCCESLPLYDDCLLGTLYSQQLADGEFTHLMTALDDFTHIPRYWGSKY